jgi:hypothetical protein
MKIFQEQKAPGSSAKLQVTSRAKGKEEKKRASKRKKKQSSRGIHSEKKAMDKQATRKLKSGGGERSWQADAGEGKTAD